VVSLELPALGQDDVKVTQTNNILTVRGARRFKKAHEEAIYHSSERNYGTFERLFPLPGNVLAERIKNKYTNGILQITIPKTKADLSGRSED
jgi:HSP20 family protein